MTQDDTLAALVALLDDEYAALRRAEFSDLDRFATRKEELSVALAAGRIDDAAGLRALADKVARNAGGLQAAGRGVRAARQRLDELRRAAEGLATYDRKGRRNGALTVPGRMERRA